MHRSKILIMGAAGRDFHNFNIAFRNDPQYEVLAFTAAQIPNIADRRYPPELAGPSYPDGIAIYPEEQLDRLIRQWGIDEVVFAYSDVSYEEVMHKASLVLAAGAGFRFLGPRATMLRAHKPVISICAVRTGCGKSPATRMAASILREQGLRVVVVRHPMPYGDLAAQAVQRFATQEDVRRADCTIEEREEYEAHLEQGTVVYAGVDYERILRRAESEADVILWDGGNNDLPFFISDLEVVLVDPHRAGHERGYFPGEVNLLRADLILITKVDTAAAEQIAAVRRSIRECNPNATVIEAAMPLRVQDAEQIRGRRVLVIEDGPTLTHGGMGFGAGVLAAKKFGAEELVDPRTIAVGSLRETFDQYPHIGPLLPAMGYSPEQIRELEETIGRATCDLVLIATPADLRRIMRIRQPTVLLRYELDAAAREALGEILNRFMATLRRQARASPEQ
jgi:predicted GTPase